MKGLAAAFFVSIVLLTVTGTVSAQPAQPAQPVASPPVTPPIPRSGQALMDLMLKNDTVLVYMVGKNGKVEVLACDPTTECTGSPPQRRVLQADGLLDWKIVGEGTCIVWKSSTGQEQQRCW